MRWCLENIQSRSVLLIWIIVGQGSIALAVGAGGACLDIFFFRLSFSLFFLTLWETAQYRLKYIPQRAVKPKTTNQPNPVVSGMRTPVYSYYHLYSRVLDKIACRSIKCDLTTHSTILDSVSRRLLLYEICRTALPLVVSQRTLVTLFSFFIALSIFFKFHPALSLLAFCEQTM